MHTNSKMSLRGALQACPPIFMRAGSVKTGEAISKFINKKGN